MVVSSYTSSSAVDVGMKSLDVQGLVHVVVAAALMLLVKVVYVLERLLVVLRLRHSFTVLKIGLGILNVLLILVLLLLILLFV